MGQYDWPGGMTTGRPTAWINDDWTLYSGGMNVPSGNAMTDGSRAVKVTSIRAVCAGKGQAVNFRMGIDGAYTGWFTMGASGQAQDTGWIGYGGIHDGGSRTVYLDQDRGGGIWFGRGGDNTGSTGTVGHSAGWPGALAGSCWIIGSPSQVPWISAVRNTNGTVTVSWGAPTDDGGEAVSVFWLNYATNSSFTQNAGQHVLGVQYSYVFSGLTAGQTYYFRITSGNQLNKDRGQGATWSGTASATTSAIPGAPGAPVVTKTPGSTSMSFSWNAAVDNGAAITAYELQWSLTSDFATIAGKSDIAGTTRTVTGFSLATKYYFRVRATNSLGDGPFSGTTIYPRITSAPSAVGVQSISSTSLKASWNAPSDLGGDSVVNYTLQRSTQASMAAGVTTTVTGLSYTITGLTALTPYYFRVQANNGIGSSPWSTISSFTTAETEPPPPPPAVTRGGRLKVNGVFQEPKVRVRVNGTWVEPASRVRIAGRWEDPV